MTITPRSLAVGLGAWCVAFLIACVSNIDPIHLTVVNVLMMLLSLVVGGFILRFWIKRSGLSVGESAVAIMTYALSWFVGIYVPITGICANASFRTWAHLQKVKPKGDELALQLVPALERLAVSHFVGAGVLLLLGYFVWKRTLTHVGKYSPMFEGNLKWKDGVFGLAALVIGLCLGPKMAEPAQILGCLGGAFLLCFLFRSLRHQGMALKKLPTETNRAPFPKKIAVVCLVALAPLLISQGIFIKSVLLGDETSGWFCILLGLIIWLIYRKGCGPLAAVSDRSGPMNHFAVRCGIWLWAGMALTLAGWVITGIAESALIKAGTLRTPFALSVVALKPVFCLAILPGGSAFVGSLLLGLAFPRWANVGERMLACAQAAAIGITIFYLTLVLFSMSLAFCTTSLLCVAVGEASLTDWFQKWLHLPWYSLTHYYMTNLGGFISLAASLWAAEAAVECGLERLVGSLKRKITHGSEKFIQT